MMEPINENLKEKLKGIKASELMSKFAITIGEDETVSNLAHLMMRFKISGVPVVSKDGNMCGIATATDLFNLMKAITHDLENGLESVNVQEIKVSALMTKDIVTINEETSLYEIMQIMYDKNIHTLPVMVITEKEILGVIGRRDILNAFYVGVKRD